MDVYHCIQVLLLSLFFHLFQNAQAIRCYSCTSSENPAQCSAHETTSPSNALTIRPVCDGSCLYTVDNSGETIAYERRCSAIRRTTQCLQVTSTVSACYCNTDLCNGYSKATSIAQNKHFIYIVMSFVLFVYLHLF